MGGQGKLAMEGVMTSERPVPSKKGRGVGRQSASKARIGHPGMGKTTKMYTVRYASTRGEIWRWYWRTWARPKGLWRYHILISLLSAVAVTAREKQSSFDAGQFFVVFGVTMLGCVVLLPMWPQIRFKPSVRTLKIDEKGFETVIGRRSGARRWKEIRSVEDSDGTIVITGNNNNAFIVPSRAFASEQERLEFYGAARRFHAGSNP